MPLLILPQASAFLALERALTRRRLMQLDPRMRTELALLALLVGGFVFWQARVPLDGLARARGASAVIAALIAVGLALAVAAGSLAGARHARRLQGRLAGPEWLALPIEPRALTRHLAWESRSRTPWFAVPVLAVLAAAGGLVPIGWLALLGVTIAGLLMVAGHVGCALGEQIAVRRVRSRGARRSVSDVLAVGARGSSRRAFAPATWRSAPAWLVLAVKDLVVTGRHPAARGAALVPLALALASLLAWRIPGEVGVRHLAAFALVLLAAGTLAEWLVWLAGSDPFAVLRVLPVGVPAVWGARFAIGVAGALLLIAGQTLAARELAPHARQVLLVWAGGASLAIVVLGVNYGVTLFPRADLARRMLGLSLGLAMVASVMIPLSGWIVLLTAVLHSARRLPRWSRLEET